MIVLAYTFSGISLLMSALFLIKPPKVELLFIIFLPLVAGAHCPPIGRSWAQLALFLGGYMAPSGQYPWG